MRGRGLPDVGGGHRGDQLVQVHVWTPRTLTPEQREILERLREEETFKPQEGPDTEERRSFFSRVRDAFREGKEG
jgi:molecular chaperone DnaJ